MPPHEGRQVPVQMLPADVMMDPHQNPFQACPDRVDPVGRDTIDPVFTHGVINELVIPARKVFITGMLVRVNGSSRGGRLLDYPMQVFTIDHFRRLGIEQTRRPVQDANDRGLSHCTSTSMQLLSGMLVLLPATDVSLIHLHGTAGNGLPLFVAAEVKPLQDEEGGVMSNTKPVR